MSRIELLSHARLNIFEMSDRKRALATLFGSINGLVEKASMPTRFKPLCHSCVGSNAFGGDLFVWKIDARIILRLWLYEMLKRESLELAIHKQNQRQKEK
jgi:hypothetical protein